MDDGASVSAPLCSDGSELVSRAFFFSAARKAFFSAFSLSRSLRSKSELGFLAIITLWVLRRRSRDKVRDKNIEEESHAHVGMALF